MTLLVKMRILERLEAGGLWSVMPGGYTSLKQAVMELGRMSSSEFSNLMDWHKVIFPYIVNELGMPIEQFWGDFRPGNLREATPYLKAIITEKPDQSRAVNETVGRNLEEVKEIGEDACSSRART